MMIFYVKKTIVIRMHLMWPIIISLLRPWLSFPDHNLEWSCYL